jgi:hypothetical protein
MFRTPQPAPLSAVPEDRRGPVVGRFCRTCGATFSRHQARHQGKGVYSRDHVASPCSHEGEAFAASEPWWEPAVVVLPLPATPAAGP